MPDTYPPGFVRELLDTELVTPATHDALEGRFAPAPETPAFFTTREQQTLAAIVSRLLSGDAPADPVPIVTEIGRRLAANESDGWRYDALPPDPEAFRMALSGFNEAAQMGHGMDFAQLEGPAQNDVLTQIKVGSAPGEVWQTLNGTRLMEELFAECVEVFYSHPLSQEEIGYAGFADRAGWQRIGLDEREAWEPLPGTRLPVFQVPAQVSPLTPNNGGIRRVPTPLAGGVSFSPAPPLLGAGGASGPVDAIVIGTGAGGAPLLARLAQAGLNVVALEAGQWWNPKEQFATDERAQNFLFWNDERLSAGTDPVAFGRNNSGTGVGGSTLHYTAYTPRPHPDDFVLHTKQGVGADWPLSYFDLEPYYDEVERFLGVSGPSPYPWGPPRTPYPLPPLPLNGAAQLMQRGCGKLGITTSPAANAALSGPYFQEGVGWRAACTNRGFCQAGCSTGAKASMDVTYIPLALAHGAEVRSECFATQIERDKTGAVSGVVYLQNGTEHRLQAKTVFLCAGAVETPRLLLINNMANSSGQVGRNFLAHPGVQVWGQFDEDVRPYKGIPGGMISEDTHRPKDADFAGGYLLQSIGVMPVTYASQFARGTGRYGTDLREHMRGYNHVAGINILGEGLPYASNYLELSDETDVRGLPKPRIFHTAGDNENAMNRHAERLMRHIWDAAGAKDVWAFPRYAHAIGTCRMGTDAGASVVNADGAVHDVPGLYISDNSTFPSALAVNPALTIMALSLRTADRFLESRR